MNADRVAKKKEKLVNKGKKAVAAGDQLRAKRLKERVIRKENRLEKNTPASKGRTPGGIVDAKAKGASESFSAKPKAGEMAKKQEYKPTAKKATPVAKKPQPKAPAAKPKTGKSQSASDVKNSAFGYKEEMRKAGDAVKKSSK
jgi:hypothetical protein